MGRWAWSFHLHPQVATRGRVIFEAVEGEGMGGFAALDDVIKDGLSKYFYRFY